MAKKKKNKDYGSIYDEHIIDALKMLKNANNRN